MKRATRLFQVIVIVAFLPLMAHAQFEYEHGFLWTQAGGMEDLGVIKGWQNSFALAISDSGQVVGTDSVNADSTTFRWTRSAGMQHLPGSSTTYSVAVAVNNSGEVAGLYYPTPGNVHAFVWTQAGGIQDLGTLGGSTSEATGINRSGQVVGYSATASGVYHAFLWTQSAGMQDLGAYLGATSYSQAWAINDDGIVAGRSTGTNGDDMIAIWRAGKIQILGPGVAYGINNRGQVTGARYTRYTGQQAFIWNPGGAGMQLLPMLPGATASFGQGINNSGEVAGWNFPATGDNAYQAFIWTPAGGTLDIGNLGGLYGAQAFAINDSGEVVGSSTIQ